MGKVEWVVTGLETKLGNPEKQVWVQTGDSFSGVRFGGKEFAASSREASLLGIRICPDCGSDQGPIPSSFAFCPKCGATTTPPDSGLRSALCHWPSFSATGLPESSRVITSLDDRREIIIQGGDWGLVAAGDPGLLIAFDHENGQILRHDGDDGWAPVSRVTTPALAPWQRSLLATSLGLFFPTEQQGLGFLPTPFVPGTKSLSSCKGPSRPIAGPGVVNKHAFLPVFAEGKIRLEGCPLAVSPARDQDQWCIVNVDDTTGIGEERFGAPYTNEAGDLFWSGARSYLVLTNSDDGFKPRRIRWREGFSAYPNTRPFRSRRGGSAWQLGHNTNPATSVEADAFHLVSLSTARQEIRQVDGPHLSYGLGTFRGDKRYEEPWVEHITDYDPSSDNSVFVPVASFGEGDSKRFVVVVTEGREKLHDFLSEQGASPADTRIFVLGRFQGAMEDLLTSFQIQSPHDISAAVFADRLLVYGRYENRIFSWRMVT